MADDFPEVVRHGPQQSECAEDLAGEAGCGAHWVLAHRLFLLADHQEQAVESLAGHVAVYVGIVGLHEAQLFTLAG